MQPARYKRLQTSWRQWLGKAGTVVASTVIRVAPPAQAAFVPYSFVVVDFGDARKELMGVDNQQFQPGDTVKCVIRKNGTNGQRGILSYGLKVQKV